MPELTNKRYEQLCHEYLLDLNQTQAAIRTGYSPRTANVQAAKLFAIPSVRARIDELLAQRSARTGVNADRVIRELARIAFASAPDFIDPNDATLRADATPDDRAAIASVRVKTIPTQDGLGVEREIKLNDKVKALELLCKHLGIITNKHDLAPGMLDAVLNAVKDVE